MDDFWQQPMQTEAGRQTRCSGRVARQARNSWSYVGVRIQIDGYGFAKRTIDIVFSLLILAGAVPILVVVAPLVQFSSPGPIIFRQKRCGKDGHYFTIYKLRTMVVEAHLVLAQDDVLRASYVKHWKLVYDPRVTKIGRVLRKTSLDELPQLWNVLRGEMSIVGPRPVQPDELAQCYGPHAELVTSVRPGLTGLWQVSGRSSISYEQRVAQDIKYVQNRDFRLDCLIMLKTIPALLLRRGAH